MSKFKILWIDDQPDKIGLEKDTVEKMLCEKGFTPCIKVIDKISDKEDRTQTEWYSKLKSREYDLLFVDFNLRSHILGSDIISDIRKSNDIYVDIVFYSSDKEKLIETIKSSFDKPIMEFIDDVHIAVLDDSDFYDKIGMVIDKIIGSWYNAHSFRGLLLAKTSKFETMINEIISLNYLPKIELLKQKLEKKKDNVSTEVAKKWNILMKESDPVLYVTSHPIDFNWNVRKMLFASLLDEGIIALNDETTTEKIDKLFGLRNNFAHNKAKIKNGELIVSINGSEKTYDVKKITSIITMINEVEDELDKLLNPESN